MMEEIWRMYLEGVYEVSTKGRVRSVDRPVLFHGQYSIRRGKDMAITRNSKGAMTVVICNNGSRKTTAVHRMVAEIFLDNPENKLQVNHIDGDRSNNSIENLEWNTPGENQDHAYQTGLKRCGEVHPNAKLTAREIPQIRDLIFYGYSYSEVALMYDVTHGTIRSIGVGKNWKYT
jgi:hypothetical protein